MVSVPLVVILDAVVFAACRYMGLRVWQAILCLLLEFFITTTAAAPEIRNLVPPSFKDLPVSNLDLSPTAKERCLVTDTSRNTRIDHREVTTRSNTARHMVARLSTAIPALTDIWQYEVIQKPLMRRVVQMSICGR
jgi:hypothetical protein